MKKIIAVLMTLAMLLSLGAVMASAFFEIDGYCKEYNLAAGEELVCDTGVVAMMEESCKMDVRMVGSVKNALFGGEGLVDTVITGPGRVMLQTMPIYKVASAIQPFIVQGK